jgi:hypothetical protein
MSDEGSHSRDPADSGAKPDAPGGDLGGGGAEMDAATLAELRRSYNAPPDPPLDAMWEQIEQHRRVTGAAESTSEEASQPESERNAKRGR